MSVLDEGFTAALAGSTASTNCNIFDLAEFAEHVVQELRGRPLVVTVHPDGHRKEDRAALGIERSYTSRVLFVVSVPRSTEDVSRVVLLCQAVNVGRHPMIVSAILALCAMAASKVHAEPIA